MHHPSKKDASNEKSIDKALSLIKMIEGEELADYLLELSSWLLLSAKEVERWVREKMEILQW